VSIDVTDATFQSAVLDQSHKTPVVVDLWAPWCGPCKQLGPILERVVDATDGKVILAKVNTDENPGIAQAFQVQSIPAVYAVVGGKPVDGFIGAVGEREVQAFVDRILPSAEDDELNVLLDAGDEASLRKALEVDPTNETATVKLAELLVGDRPEESLALLEKIPESAETRHIAALARHGGDRPADIESRLDALLPQVKGDDDARREFLDLLELLGPDDPRTADYRKQLTTRLY
jgi:putative thioredoxin